MPDKTEQRKYSLKINPPTLMEVMTLRDYFAAKAMQGIIVNAERNEFSFGKVDEIASKAYELADAMLRARGES